MDDLESQLNAGRSVYVEAPAGYGKTHLILSAIARNPNSRQLVLTHTVAGVAALRSRLKDFGLKDSNVHIGTIAGWVQRYVKAFPSLAGVDLIALSQLDGNDYWSGIVAGFSNLLEQDNVIDIINANFDGVYIDEYQDCSKDQHSLAVKLAGILPVRVMGDPLQGIFDFTNNMVPWTDVQSSFSHLATLDTPHRWNNAGNVDYGRWVARVRMDLEAGNVIDLSNVPESVKVVTLTDDVILNRQSVLHWAGAKLPKGRHRLIIGDRLNAASKALVKSLSRPRYTLLESLDSKDVSELKEYAVLMDAQKNDSDLKIGEILCKYFTGLSALKATALKLKTDSSYKPRKQMVLDLAALRTEFNASTALRVVKEVEQSPTTSCHRRQLATILEMALTSLVLGECQEFSTAVSLAVESIRQRGRHIPRYSVGSTLLVKGLQVEEVMLLNAHELERKDLYVAVTRPTLGLIIFTTTMQLNPRS